MDYSLIKVQRIVCIEKKTICYHYTWEKPELDAIVSKFMVNSEAYPDVQRYEQYLTIGVYDTEIVNETDDHVIVKRRD